MQKNVLLLIFTIFLLIFCGTAFAASGNGLLGSYYGPNNMNLSGSPAFTQVDSQVNFTNWNPGHGVGSTQFSVKWTGCIRIPENANYWFYTVSDDGVRLFINGSQVINDWNDHGSTTDWSAGIYFTAGTYVSVEMDYYQDGGNSVAKLGWSDDNSIGQQLIPQADLYSTCPGASTATPTNIVINTPTKTLTGGGGPVFTPTVTATVTATPVTPYYQGLSPSARLYDLEYIPFPKVSDGGNVFLDLADTIVATSSNNVPRNTARWRIVLQNLGTVTNTAAPGQFVVETRIGSVGTGCTTGLYYYNFLTPTPVTSLPIPSHPSNLSTSYFWINGATVPYTEQIDAMGDPRYTPYLDVIHWSGSSSSSFKDNYNWFFKNLSNSSPPDYQAAYQPFVPQAIWDGYNSDAVRVDIPKLFRLYREGLFQSTSILNVMTGWDSYYFGNGGEMGGDSSNKLSGGGVPMYSSPWGGTGTQYINEITSPRQLVRRGTAWRSLPWLGELWEDSVYLSQWAYSSTSVYGNLNNTQSGLSGANYVRDKWSNCGTSTWTLGDGTARNFGDGCATLFNGNGGSSTFNHYADDGLNSSLIADGIRLGSEFLDPAPLSFTVARPFGLNAGGNTPPEWSYNPYANNRTSLSFYDAKITAPNTTNVGFFQKNDSSSASDRSSAAVRLIDASGTRAAWIIVNGLAPSDQSGYNFVASFGLLSAMHTFLDAGAPTGSSYGVNNQVGSSVFRIEPVPLVQITSPDLAADLRGQSSVNVSWTLTWERWDQNPYTDAYPAVGAWNSSVGISYNLKYSEDDGNTWKSVLTGAPETAGVYYPTEAYSSTSYTWNVSGFSPQHRLFRVEVYRPSIGQHYGYHYIDMYIAP